MRRFATLLLLAWGGSAAAIPPPAPPIEVRSGPEVICTPRYALRVEAGEKAERHGDDWWILIAGGRQLFVRVDVPPAEQARPIVLSDGRAGRTIMRRVFPGGDRPGRIYWLGEPTVMVASTQVEEDALVGRVLLAAARDEACAHSR
ncbi:hypothetical protein GGR88_000349 [Sphingomonas jejuensis]|uniref:Uncharacterized protein n=1 Tax=Sphingomonas jejuensis TaxID=904715 RepID=A0ABX0XI14_9SPHN|nr:hypothetical protein [Sphingomonas jejuensis]NJC32875.1 hypothetical protein [Sphingomonas jejuensis]